MAIQDAIICAYLLLIIAYTPSFGFYSSGGLILVFVALMALILSKKELKTFINDKLRMLLILSLALSIFFKEVDFNPSYVYTLQILLIPCLLISLLYFSKKPSKTIPLLFKYKFIALFAFAIMIRVFPLVMTNEPVIDVLDQLKYGNQALLRFENPYQITFPKIYVDHIPTIFGYPPGSLLLALPFKFLLGDHRYLFVIADLLSALVLYSLSKKIGGDKERAELISLVFLFNPMSTFIIRHSWLDPILTCLVLLFLYAYSKKNINFALILFAISITAKQTMLLAIPAFLLSLRWRIKDLLLVAGVVVAITLPFVAWSPKDFIFDLTAGFNPAYNTAPVAKSLNLVGLEHQLDFKLPLPYKMVAIVLLLGYTLMKFSRKSLSGFIIMFTLTTYIITFFYTQAFLNYYHFISSLLLINLVFYKPKQG